MPLDPPEFDESLNGHNAVALQEEEDMSLCHAVISEYDEAGEQYDVTVCGDRLAERASDGSFISLHYGPRIEFENEGVPMCDECWPESVLKSE